MYCDLERDWTLKLEPFPLWNYSQESTPEELKEWLMFQFSSLQGLVQPDLVFRCLEQWSELRSPRGVLGSWMIWWDRGECWVDAECTCVVLMIVSPCGRWCLSKYTSSWMHPLFLNSSLWSLTCVIVFWPIFNLHLFSCFWKKKKKRNCILFWGVTACGKKNSICLSCTSLQRDSFSRGDEWLALSNQGGKILF